MKLGILGGTFDPIHMGHLIIAEEAREQLNLDEVLFIPTGNPWMKTGTVITPAVHRLSMVKLAIRANPHFKASSMEIDRPGETYTIDTLTDLRAKSKSPAEIFFIVGMDSLKSFHRWKEPQKILELCTVVAVSRPGYADVNRREIESVSKELAGRVRFLEGDLIEISGTDIRRRVAQGRSIRYRVPREVEEYISKHHLYQEEALPT